MIPTELIATAIVPGGGGELRCLRHGEDWRIFIGQVELMSNRNLGSESVLAELSLERRGAARAQNTLIGGLGMGYTLARTLELVGASATVEVAELVPEIVTWNRELFGHCAGRPLEDPRTRLTVGDVGDVLASSPGAYDVVMLDVDNGPEGLSRPSNSALYGQRGLACARAALRPQGVLSVWSSADSPEFDQRLRRSGFHVSRHRTRARRTKGPWRTIWVASRTGS